MEIENKIKQAMEVADVPFLIREGFFIKNNLDNKPGERVKNYILLKSGTTIQFDEINDCDQISKRLFVSINENRYGTSPTTFEYEININEIAAVKRETIKELYAQEVEK